VTTQQADALLAHLDAVLEVNSRLNLTAITDRVEAISLHVVDSVALLRLLGKENLPIADIGSGAGFPGIPLSICAGIPVSLVESSKKKARFLSECLESFGGLSGSEVIPLRAEELASERPGAYGCVVARALSSLPSLVELASPLLRQGGILVAMKGSPTIEERKLGVGAGQLVGMREFDWLEYQLPESGQRRTLVRYRRSGTSRIELPRRNGLAQKRPLS
jgi:16S rRNA (guanine527-N7)-methyltransferase